MTIRRQRLGMAGLAALAVVLAGFDHRGRAEDPADAPRRAGLDAVVRADHPHRHRAPLRGYDFPDHVLSLTWDDGPDVHTVELARYLHEHHVAGTFFVVAEWTPRVSDEPGHGAAIWATGHRHLPVLEELVGLGHRVGSHTKSHAILPRLATADVVEQLEDNQEALDPLVTNELRLFRAPGGAWSEAAALALEDPALAGLVGPVHWDMDAKDWDSSLYCRVPHGPDDCEPGPIPGEPRVRASVIAQRYLAQIEHQRRGIVLFHDRVGDVGSRYALDVAEALVPELVARGYVFAAPVLGFSPLRKVDIGGAALLADVDGDGRADRCEDTGDALRCARATLDRIEAQPHVAFAPTETILDLPAHAALAIGDVDGDGRPDVCARTEPGRFACARARIEIPSQRSHAEPPTHLGHAPFADFAAALPGSELWLADVDGDGRADACARADGRLACAFAGPAGFAPPRTVTRGIAGRLVFGDLDGDRRSDLCVEDEGHVRCARSLGRSFGPLVAHAELAGRGLLLGDLNGDGRADACVAAEGLRCALSDGHGFKPASTWANAGGDLRLADLDGDGRSDLCVVDAGLACGMAP